MGLQYFKRGVYAGGAGNRDLSSDLVMSSGGLAFDAAITASTAAEIAGYGLVTITGADATSVYTLAAPPSDRVREVIITCINATSSMTAKVFLTTGTTDAHYQSSASATTTERSLHFPHSASYARLLATSSHVWLVTAKSTGVLQESTG